VEALAGRLESLQFKEREGGEMNIYKDITQTIGRTPLVQLNKLTQGLHATVVGRAACSDRVYSLKVGV